MEKTGAGMKNLKLMTSRHEELGTAATLLLLFSVNPPFTDDFCLPAEHEAVNLPPISRERHLTGSVETSAHQQGLYHYVQSPDIAASGSARQSWRESGPIKPLMGVGLPDAGLQEESQTDDLGPPPPPEDPENLLGW